MIRCASQREGEPHQLKTWQNQVEPGGILGSKPPREEVLANVIKVELGLYANNIRAVVGKGENSFLQLQWIRNIFSVVDDDIGSLCMHQPIITSAWLGAWFAVGHNQDLEVWGQR